MPNSKDRFQNQLLAALPEKDRSEVAPFLTEVRLRTGTVLAEPYTSLKYLYFPHESMVSMVSVVAEGTGVEIAMVGPEGLVGATALLQRESIPYRIVVQVPGGASRIELKKLKRLFDEHVRFAPFDLRVLACAGSASRSIGRLQSFPLYRATPRSLDSCIARSHTQE